MTINPDSYLYTLALARVNGVGIERWRRLHLALGTPEAICRASISTLKAIGLPEKVAHGILNPDWQGAEADLNWLRSGANRHLLTIDCPDYPQPLREIPRPPMVLFVAGSPQLLHLPQISIVGSRHATAAGKELAAQFAKALVDNGFAITSGLAAGIDAAAHRGALEANGTTHAVIATGPEQVYPHRHRQLRDAIANSGTVLGESPTGVGPQAKLFPQRNRIVSGLSHGVVVIQAGRQSGALITARMAAEQGREVFAIPGSIHDPLVRGCHALLRDGAKLVESIHDILEELTYSVSVSSSHNRTFPEADNSRNPEACTNHQRGNNDERGRLLAALGHDPVTLDTLIRRSGLTLDRVSSILLDMEIKGLVAALPGGRYQRHKPGV